MLEDDLPDLSLQTHARASTHIHTHTIFTIHRTSWVQGYTPATPALRKLRQEDFECQAIPAYEMNSRPVWATSGTVQQDETKQKSTTQAFVL